MASISIKPDGAVESLSARARNRQTDVVKEKVPIVTTVKPKPKGIAEDLFKNLLDENRARFAKKTFSIPKPLAKELKEHPAFKEAEGILREMGIDPYSTQGRSVLETKLQEITKRSEEEDLAPTGQPTAVSIMRDNLKRRIIEVRDLLRERESLKQTQRTEYRNEHQQQRYENITDRLKSTLQYIRSLRRDIDRQRKRKPRT